MYIKNCTSRLLLFFIFFPILINANTLSVDTNLNKLKSTNLDASSFKFFVGGHLYGSPSPSLYLSSSLLRNINEIKSQKAGFFISMGDIIQHSYSPDAIEFQYDDIRDFVRSIDIPFFNSPGNHDLHSDKDYIDNFSQKYFSFRVGKNLFLIFDSESKECGNDKSMINYFSDKLLNVNSSNTSNIFFISHQPLWASNKHELKNILHYFNLKQRLNKCESFSDNFLKQMNLKSDLNIYYLSGDVGCRNYSLGDVPILKFSNFYHTDNNSSNITYLANGLCENEDDNLLLINVQNDNVQINIFPLGSPTSMAIEDYNVDYWKNFSNPGFFENIKKHIRLMKIALKNLFSSL
jgi:hypothetical protein